MSSIVCKLCECHLAIKNSHVIPSFVYRAIKSDSPTGYLRNPNNPNVRLQDGDKFPLLCKACEQRFGDAEQEFANKAFSVFHHNDTDEFSYGPWLHYFMTSLAWRTLILDLPGLESDVGNPIEWVCEMAKAARVMQHYLLGATHLGGSLRNHAVVWTKAHSGNAQLGSVGPNVMVRRTPFGYSVLYRRHGYSGVLHNLAGFMCFFIIKSDPRDTWNGTKVNPTGGSIVQPQHVSSWLIAELLDCLIEAHRGFDKMSEAQRERIAMAMNGNPNAAAPRFREFDKSFVRIQEQVDNDWIP